MKPKTIKSVLRRKIDDWLASITDELVREAAKKDAIVTGGSIASMLLGEDVNDYDIYFRTQSTARMVAEYYVAAFCKNPPQRFKDFKKLVNVTVKDEGGRIKIVIKSSGIAGESGSEEYVYFEQQEGSEDQEAFVEQVMADAQEATDADKSKPKYRPVFLSANAITLSHRVQVVIRFTGEPEQIHENYDFIHCTCSWDAATGKLRLPKTALESLLGKYLIYQNSKYPVCAVIRTRKFLSRGWTISAGQYLKMLWDVSELDLTDIDVLEDQLVGVDTAYFAQVIELLRKRGEVDRAYLAEVVDKIF